MAQSLDLYIDTTNGNLVAAGSARDGSLPVITRNDYSKLRVRLLETDKNGFYRDIDLSNTSVQVGIGEINAGPSSGSFKLTRNSVTSLEIQYNATTTDLYNAISGIAGLGVNVATYGIEPFSYLITAATDNTALSLGGSSFTLFPTSSVAISTRKFPAPSAKAQQIIKLIRNTAVYSDVFTISPTAGVVTLSKVQDGSATQNETYSLAIGSDAVGGSVVLNYGQNTTTGIAVGSSALVFSDALSSVTGIGAGNISVDSGNNAGEYSISFVRNLGLQNITTALTLDSAGVIYAKFLQTTITMATAELNELFAEEALSEFTKSLEVKLIQPNNLRTIYQGPITIRAGLVDTSNIVPAQQTSYYTKAECDSLFATNPPTFPALNNYYTKTESDARYPTTTALNNYYTKTESDGRYLTTTAFTSVTINVCSNGSPSTLVVLRYS